MLNRTVLSAHAEIHDEVEAALGRVLASSRYILGDELAAFERELATWLGVGHAIGVACGTDALVLAMWGMGVRPGDEILTTDVTAVPTVAAIEQAGAVPVLVDVEPTTGLLNAELLESMVTARTRGIVPVHLYGRSCDMTSILAMAAAYDLWVIEDCAQSIGARHAGRMTGGLGACGAFSFYPTKNLGAYGDAGAVVCEDAGLAEQLRSLRNYGQRSSGERSERGMNSRLDEVQAAILRVKLHHLQEYTTRRNQLAERYRKSLPACVLPSEAMPGEHVYHLFPILVPDRNLFQRSLRDAGVGSLVHYAVPMHRLTRFGPMPDERFPEACSWSSQVVSIPLHPNLDEQAQEQVISAVKRALD